MPVLPRGERFATATDLFEAAWEVDLRAVLGASEKPGKARQSTPISAANVRKRNSPSPTRRGGRGGLPNALSYHGLAGSVPAGKTACHWTSVWRIPCRTPRITRNATASPGFSLA